MVIDREHIIGIARNRHKTEAVALVGGDGNDSEGSGEVASIASQTVDQSGIRLRRDSRCSQYRCNCVIPINWSVSLSEWKKHHLPVRESDDSGFCTT